MISTRKESCSIRLLLIFLFVAMLGMALTACETNEPIQFDFVQNSETGATISLGMSRADAEDFLGEGTPFEREKRSPLLNENGEPYGEILEFPNEDSPLRLLYGVAENRIMVIYENDRVVGMTASHGFAEDGSSPSNWSLPCGLACGDSKEDMIACYGAKETDLVGSRADGLKILFYDYYFDSSGYPTDDLDRSFGVIGIALDQINETILTVGTYYVTESERNPEAPEHTPS